MSGKQRGRKSCLIVRLDKILTSPRFAARGRTQTERSSHPPASYRAETRLVPSKAGASEQLNFE